MPAMELVLRSQGLKAAWDGPAEPWNQLCATGLSEEAMSPETLGQLSRTRRQGTVPRP